MAYHHAAGRHGGRGGGVEHRDSQSSMSSAPYSFWLGAAADGVVSEGVGSDEVGGVVSEGMRSIGIDDPGGV